MFLLVLDDAKRGIELFIAYVTDSVSVEVTSEIEFVRRGFGTKSALKRRFAKRRFPISFAGRRIRALAKSPVFVQKYPY